jgi:predicted HAD superfamily Cof-like phosphohydrolase
MSSDAELVREFTREAGQRVPNVPEPMQRRAVKFLVEMVLDELMELMATVMEPKEAKEVLRDYGEKGRYIFKREYAEEDEEELEKIADQADALVDVYYYMLNAAARHGMNLSRVFKVVHEANMAKRDKKTGKFLKREDGKILKPEGWLPPNVMGEMLEQKLYGAFGEREGGGEEKGEMGTERGSAGGGEGGEEVTESSGKRRREEEE